jgi:hypothetical protein
VSGSIQTNVLKLLDQVQGFTGYKPGFAPCRVNARPDLSFDEISGMDRFNVRVISNFGFTAAVNGSFS